MSDLFPERIETDRLVLAAATTETVDLLDLYEVCKVGAPGIDEVTEYLTWRPHETPNDTREFVEYVTERREGGEGTDYLIRPKEGEVGAGELAGLTTISADWETKSAELGIWLRKRFWGRGYSGERAAALLEVAFEHLDLDLVVVTVHRGNEKSRRAVEKYVEAHGGRREGLLRNFHTDRDGDPVDVHRFSVSAAEYREASAAGSDG
jgi:RimJ/RimL family protein N-acetyltransferase